jgi:molybdate-binding protein
MPRFERYLDADGDVLIHVVRREQGIMTAVGNPKKIRGIKDLTRKDVRFLNRQPGSGTRLISDAMFEEAGLDTRRVRGFGSEEFTHMAVAAMIASGAADAGFGIKAAAAQFGLGFIPVARENYWFAVDRELSTTAPVKELVSILTGRDYRRKVAALQGYDATDAGDMAKVAQLTPAS